MPTHELVCDVTHVYATYARAIDEKRYDLLQRVFTPDAALDYVVGSHRFTARGEHAAAAFKPFLDRCYWTQHVIAPPMVDLDASGRVAASARVIATHLQRLPEGTLTRWQVRGSYHDRFVRSHDGLRIAQRFCFCPDEEGEFTDTGVEEFPQVAWANREVLG